RRTWAGGCSRSETTTAADGRRANLAQAMVARRGLAEDRTRPFRKIRPRQLPAWPRHATRTRAALRPAGVWVAPTRACAAPGTRPRSWRIASARATSDGRGVPSALKIPHGASPGIETHV